MARWPLVRAILPRRRRCLGPPCHIWCDAQNIWHVEDLSSTNGTVVVNGATRVCIQVEPGRSAQLNPGDELKLGESTTYAILFGAL